MHGSSSPPAGSFGPGVARQLRGSGLLGFQATKYNSNLSKKRHLLGIYNQCVNNGK